MNSEIINVHILKNLIKNEIDYNVNDNIVYLNDKLKKLENENLKDCVEIYGVHDNRLNNKKIRNNRLKQICEQLNLNHKAIIDSWYNKNHIVVRLRDVITAKEWQNRSRELRLKNINLNIDYDGPIKIFVAAPLELKVLLKKTRDALLPYYKYVSLCKSGVMVRKNDKSEIYIVKNEKDIFNLLKLNSNISTKFEISENLL
ncbi:FP-25K [Urbanus proteus nucleopolyhedrovirus]|uniref:FP-25K n=1 Tax=Urbanus proteus nucleopolyhedrovirus TaxID=1675866 RepID=A0A162GUK8_9ABAC|nr:FP-25K [Urbanus proteus nucleopolyhedrovirus]AKR17353.1 FP-25K [Urbanus proteus nucleopolyhedrovirus]